MEEVDSGTFNPPKDSQNGMSSTSNEKEMVFKIYECVRKSWPGGKFPHKPMMYEKTAAILGMELHSVHNILKDGRKKRESSPMSTKIVKYSQITETDKVNIRKKVHSFYFKCELPTFEKVLEAVNDDDELPNLKRSTLERLIDELKFRYIKRQGTNDTLIEYNISLKRLAYIRPIKKCRSENRPIFYVGLTQVDPGYTTATTASAKNPYKENLIVLHMANKDGFIEEALQIFESKGDKNSKTIDEPTFEQWFEKILPKLGENSVVVIENAAYSCREVEKTPDSLTPKTELQEWLTKRGISYAEDEFRFELLEKVKAAKPRNKTYILNEMAKKYNLEVLRIPIYHSDLNPMHLVWAVTKEKVARKNSTLKLEDVKKLFCYEMKNVSVETWRNCIDHVINLEENYYGKIDDLIDNVTDSFMEDGDSQESSEHYSPTDDDEDY